MPVSTLNLCVNQTRALLNANAVMKYSWRTIRSWTATMVLHGGCPMIRAISTSRRSIQNGEGFHAHACEARWQMSVLTPWRPSGTRREGIGQTVVEDI